MRTQLGDRRQKKVTIDGDPYVITVMGAMAARRVWFKVIAALSGGLGRVKDLELPVPGAGGQVEVSLLDVPTGDIGQAIHGALESLGVHDFDAVCDALAQTTDVGMQGGFVSLATVFDDWFAGRPLAMSKWLYHALEVNFADFLSAFADLKLRTSGPEKEQSSTTSPDPSTGSSGDR